MNATTGPDFVLVHGAFEDASAWTNVVPLLEAAGASVTTFTLPAHSDADNANAGRTTLDDYIEATRVIVSASDRPVILAGHSMGGMVITGAAEADPERIAALVYVCAILPENGRSLASYSATDTESKFSKDFKPDTERGVGTITREGLIEAVFSQTSESEAAAATAIIRDEPLQPFAAEAQITADRFGSVPRFAVTTTHDHALTPSLQHAMYEAQPCEHIYAIDADHAPMLSATNALVEALLDVRERLSVPG